MSLAFSIATSEEPPRLTDYEDHLLLIHPLRVIPFTHPDGKRIDAVLTDVPQQLVWILDTPTQADVDLAQLYLDEHGDPFTNPV